MVGIWDGTVWWGVITSLRAGSWTVQAVQSRILYKYFSRTTVKQIEHIILRCLRCTLPASPSYPAHETRARTHTHTLHASSTDSADRRYVHRDQVPFHAFHCLFSIESLQNLLGPNGVKTRIFGLFRFHRIFFSIEKKCAKTRPKTRPQGRPFSDE